MGNDTREHLHQVQDLRCIYLDHNVRLCNTDVGVIQSIGIYEKDGCHYNLTRGRDEKDRREARQAREG